MATETELDKKKKITKNVLARLVYIQGYNPQRPHHVETEMDKKQINKRSGLARLVYI